MPAEISIGSTVRIITNSTSASRPGSELIFEPGDLAIVKSLCYDGVVVESEGHSCSPSGMSGRIFDGQVLRPSDVELVSNLVVEDPFFRELLGD